MILFGRDAPRQTSPDFLAQYMVAQNFIVAPDVGVMQKYARPVLPMPGDLAPCAIPQNAVVPAVTTITDNWRDSLGMNARAFFREVMRPTVKHV